MSSKLGRYPSFVSTSSVGMGTRITVQSILELLNDGLSFDAIIQDYYPDLQVEDIRACLRYAIALVASEDIHLISA